MNKLKSLEELFDGRHFDQEIIIVCVCVRWYLSLAATSERELAILVA
jgi:transposase-like protein